MSRICGHYAGWAGLRRDKRITSPLSAEGRVKWGNNLGKEEEVVGSKGVLGGGRNEKQTCKKKSGENPETSRAKRQWPRGGVKCGGDPEPVEKKEREGSRTDEGTGGKRSGRRVLSPPPTKLRPKIYLQEGTVQQSKKTSLGESVGTSRASPVNGPRSEKDQVSVEIPKLAIA